MPPRGLPRGPLQVQRLFLQCCPASVSFWRDPFKSDTTLCMIADDECIYQLGTLPPLSDEARRAIQWHFPVPVHFRNDSYRCKVGHSDVILGTAKVQGTPHGQGRIVCCLVGAADKQTQNRPSPAESIKRHLGEDFGQRYIRLGRQSGSTRVN